MFGNKRTVAQLAEAMVLETIKCEFESHSSDKCARRLMDLDLRTTNPRILVRVQAGARINSYALLGRVWTKTAVCKTVERNLRVGSNPTECLLHNGTTGSSQLKNLLQIYLTIINSLSGFRTVLIINKYGEVAERLMALVLKTRGGESPPWVRIPLSPLIFN